jgi:hypothetical protein
MENADVIGCRNATNTYEAEFLQLTKGKLNYERQTRNRKFSTEENTSERN